MVANIRTGATVGGAIRYNEEKVNRGQAGAVHLSAGCGFGISRCTNLRRATTADSEKEEKAHESALTQPHFILHRHNEHPPPPPDPARQPPHAKRTALVLVCTGRPCLFCCPGVEKIPQMFRRATTPCFRRRPPCRA